MHTENSADIQSLPTPLSSACDHIRNAIRQTMLARFNYPREAANAIVSFHVATELILSWSAIKENEKGGSAKKLIRSFSKWDADEKASADIIRKERNNILHEGELTPESQRQIVPLLEEYLGQVGDLCRIMDVPFNQEFSIYEVAVLRREPIEWQLESEYYARIAKAYLIFDFESAIDCANHAYEIAFRGFACAWQVGVDERLPIEEIKSQLLDIGEYFACGLEYRDWDEEDGYQIKVIGDTAPACFDPPLTISMVCQKAEKEWSNSRAVEVYTRTMLDYVLYLPLHAPNLNFRNSFAENFPRIIEDMVEKFSDIPIPQLDLEQWQTKMFYPDVDTLMIPVKNPPQKRGLYGSSSHPCDFWQGEQLDYFEDLIHKYCGELPVDISRFVPPDKDDENRIVGSL